MSLEDDFQKAKFDLEQIQKELAKFDTEPILAEIQALQAEIARKRELLAETKIKAQPVRQQMRDAEKTLESVERQVIVEREAAAIQAEIDAMSIHLAELTKNAKWQGHLLPHQIYGSDMLATARRAICADSMGTGKTRQGIAYMDKVQAKRALIVCPGDVVENFAEEVREWAPDRNVFVLSNRTKAKMLRLMEIMATSTANFTFVVNYEAWNRSTNNKGYNQPVIDAMIACHFDTVILDEAHTIKEQRSAAFKGMYEVVNAFNRCPACQGYLPVGAFQQCETCQWSTQYPDINGERPEDIKRRSVQNLLCMTGTPILNRPSELWTLLHLINPLSFPNKYMFLNEYCSVGNDGKYYFREAGMETLARRLRGMYLRRTHDSAGIVLPKQNTVVHSIELDEEEYPLQFKILNDLETSAQIQVTSGENPKMPALLALITRLRQAAVWPGGISVWQDKVDPETGEQIYHLDDDFNWVPEQEYVNVGKEYQESAKLDKACQLIEEMVADGQRVAVFSQFREPLAEMGRRLGDIAVEFHGGTSDELKGQVRHNFDRQWLAQHGEEKKWDVVLANYKSGGLGLNFTACTQVIILDEAWAPGYSDQAYGRVNRLGQTEETTVHILRLVERIDEWLAQLNEMKRSVIEKFNTAVDIEADLLKILSLREFRSEDWE